MHTDKGTPWWQVFPSYLPRPIAATPTLPSSPFLFPSLQRAAVPLLSEYFSGWQPNPSDALIRFIRAHPSAPYSLKQRNLVVSINKKLISNNFDIKLLFCKWIFFPSLVPVFQMGVSSGKHDVASLYQYVHKNTLMENKGNQNCNPDIMYASCKSSVHCLLHVTTLEYSIVVWHTHFNYYIYIIFNLIMYNSKRRKKRQLFVSLFFSFLTQ